MSCEICSELILEPDHFNSPKHIKNKILFEYTKNCNKFLRNHKDVDVNYQIVSRNATTISSDASKIEISVKPNDPLQINFILTNNTQCEDILIVGIELAYSDDKFTINNHGMNFGEAPFILQPNHSIPEGILVTFKPQDGGAHVMPVMFMMTNTRTPENIIIIWKVVVIVEDEEPKPDYYTLIHSKKKFRAELFKNTIVRHRPSNVFCIPKPYKEIFANGLNMKRTWTSEKKVIINEIRNIIDAGVTPENYARLFHILLWYDETILRINIKRYHLSKVSLKKVGKYYSICVPGLAEKRPSLLQGDLLLINVHNDNDTLFEAVVGDIEDNVAYVHGFHGDFKHIYGADVKFDVRFIISRVNLERMHRALQCVAHGLQARVFPVMGLSNKPYKITRFFNPLIETNAEQRLAIEHIVAATSGTAPYIVHGPPGTGKTVTIVEAILQIIESNPLYRVLVCTDSNMAADHVASSLVKYHDQLTHDNNFLLRSNAKTRPWESLPVNLVPYSNGTSFNTWQRVTKNEMYQYKVVVCTLSHSAILTASDEAESRVSHLFIDEAAQASEPAALVAVAALRAGGQLVLAGDHRQLGPVLMSHDAKRYGLGTSLMERLAETCSLYNKESPDPNYIVMLKNNFRSHSEILEIPNKKFYDNQLITCAPLDPLSYTDILGKGRQNHAIVFHGICSEEKRVHPSPSYSNEMEFNIVQMYIKLLMCRHKVKPEDIGVVTPYLRQVYLIRKWLKDNNLHSLEVGTVEAFQGKEKRVIIISTVRADVKQLEHDSKFKLGFLVEDKRFNVAVTRAKAKLIVIGNPLLLALDSKWRSYMDRCREHGTYCGFDIKVHQANGVSPDLVHRFNNVMNEVKDAPNVQDKTR